MRPAAAAGRRYHQLLRAAASPSPVAANPAPMTPGTLPMLPATQGAAELRGGCNDCPITACAANRPFPHNPAANPPDDLDGAALGISAHTPLPALAPPALTCHMRLSGLCLTVAYLGTAQWHDQNWRGAV